MRPVDASLPVACGLGGLAWDDVRPRIEAALAGLDDLEAVVFGPSGAPDRPLERVPGAAPQAPR